LPALVILVEVARRFGRQLRSRSVAADFAAVLLAAVLATVVWHMWRLPAAPVESNHTSGLWGRLTEVPNLLSYYVNLTLWPSDLGVDPVPPDGNCAATLALCLGLAATISVVFYARAGRAIIGLGIALLGLAPVLQIIPIFNSVAERFIYLPMAGLALMVAAALAAAANRGRRWNWLLAGCWSAVCVLYLPLTAKQVSVWQNELTLFTASVHSNPHSARGHYNLARAQQAAGLWADAARHYRAAIALSYEKGFVHYNLGLTLAALNEWEAAEHAFQAAAELLPSDARPWNNLGVIAAQQGRYQDAAFSFEQALAREPESLKTLQNLYLACVHLGDTERANWAAAEAQRLLAPQPAAGH